MDFAREITPLIHHEDKRRLITWLQQHQLLADNMDCIQCNQPMHLASYSGSTDQFAWKCNRNTCRGKLRSIRTGSFFDSSKCSLGSILHVIFLWTIETNVKQAVIQTAVSKTTIIEFYRRLREICTSFFNANPVRLGGPGVSVQVDESLFRHKQKYHRGRAPTRNAWVLGIVDTQYTPARGYMTLVRRRDARTLLPIIRRVVLPGSTIHTDMWRAYQGLSQDPNYTYAAVNHSENFVDPNTGVHTQHVESYWNKSKKKLKASSGTTLEMLPGYLHERMWRDRHDFGNGTALANILQHIANAYPV